MNRLILCLPLTLCACDEIVSLDNAPPTVQAEALCQEDGRTYVVVRALDLEEHRVDVELSTSNGRIPSGPTGDGLRGLPTDARGKGRLHLIEWGAACAGGPACTDPCASLGDALSAESPDACARLPATAPSSVELIVRASDADLAEPVSATVSLADACPQR
jgi:hypothetical protein